MGKASTIEDHNNKARDMAQPSQQVPPRAFSPPQPHQQQAPSPSPVAQQPGFALPSLPPTTTAAAASSRPPVRTGSFAAQSAPSPGPPASPYSAPSPYPTSPSVATPTNAPSPSAYQNLQPAPPQPPTTHIPPPPSYANGASTPTSSFPPRPHHVPISAAAPPVTSGPLTPNLGPGTPGAQQFTNQMFAPAINSAPVTPGGMMPPPTSRPQREYEYDVTDSLLGTGVNIRDEENALAEYYAGTFGQDARTGLPANAPGNRASFYGGGFANQPGAPVTVSQKEFEAAEAERAWNESAARLAQTRAVEHNNPFLNYGNLHARLEKIATSHGIELNLDNKKKPEEQHLQKSRNPVDYGTVPKVTVTTKTGPDGALVNVYGTVLPPDCYLIDQLALLSLGTQHRMREIIADCDKLTTHRQQNSHGVVPRAWADNGVPLEAAGLYDPKDAERNGGQTSTGTESENGANPRKRGLQALNPLSQYLRDYAYAERNAEEERLRKRQKRLQEDSGPNGSRAGSVAPGTPGSVAPEPEKAPTKKEQKKAAAQKHDASAESVNTTTMKFLGGGKKKYSWMTGGAGGPRTPSRATGGAPGTPTSVSTPKAPETTALTPEPRTRMGSWRETSEKGQNIQLRDLLTVMERDGRDKQAIQAVVLQMTKQAAKERY